MGGGRTAGPSTASPIVPISPGASSLSRILAARLSGTCRQPSSRCSGPQQVLLQCLAAHRQTMLPRHAVDQRHRVADPDLAQNGGCLVLLAEREQEMFAMRTGRSSRPTAAISGPSGNWRRHRHCHDRDVAHSAFHRGCLASRTARVAVGKSATRVSSRRPLVERDARRRPRCDASGLHLDFVGFEVWRCQADGLNTLVVDAGHRASSDLFHVLAGLPE
jgi:hypothetical protein